MRPICKAGESRWYRVPILPGQQVSADVLDPHLDVTLALFEDIRQVADEMNAAQARGLTLEDVRRVTASNPQDVGAPDVGSSDVGSPDVGSPDAYLSAQLQAILAYSDKPGPSSEFVRIAFHCA